MKRKDFLLGLLVVTIWGANFTVIKLGLSDMPSMLLVSLRYIFTAFPAIFWVKRPKIKWKYILSFGLTIGAGQFGCLFYAMELGMPPGVASIVLQTQAFFTFLFAALILKERLLRAQLAGLFVAAAGLFLVASAGSTKSLPTVPFLITLLGGAFWAISNITVRLAVKDAESRGEKLDMVGLIVWSALFPPILLLLFAFLLDTPQALFYALSHAGSMAVFVVLYQSLLASIFGFSVWSALIGGSSASAVAPLSLLVPVSGLLTSWAVFGETLSPAQYVGGLLVLSGVFITNLQKKEAAAPPGCDPAPENPPAGEDLRRPEEEKSAEPTGRE